MFKFDLKSEHHHIEVNENFSTAMFLFKRIARPLLKYWHKHLIKMACFLEDGLSMPEPFSEATCNSNFVQETLQKSGSLLHSEKSAWEPQELITQLGVALDLRAKTFNISIQFALQSDTSYFSSSHQSALDFLLNHLL